MFDFGFSELVVIGVVMLIVVGPERLPKVARTAGHLLGRLQRYVSDVKSDIQREMQLEELKKLQQQVQQQAQALESSVRTEVAQVESSVDQVVAAIKADAAPPDNTTSAESQAAADPAAVDSSQQLELRLDTTPKQVVGSDKA
ncbi:Sec-independent protein translocase protein TatB [Azoarcus olearius]|uniref:Sec-independent protein translocase protein TatB n=1 Tax=Azoarcus sp. (strain BH72) TaxID=418699 RepID=TATB_AZOSB|nr:Sec-independent protein translocase protein TatB [Azoarcus olearius]A1KAU9.1 RecName: Full=Sec-independent protein translocase protein TatB [Azoarcus olearius]CAL95955.1 putative Sec-independent protein translocase protein [Azoarcus olearius]